MKPVPMYECIQTRKNNDAEKKHKIKILYKMKQTKLRRARTQHKRKLRDMDQYRKMYKLEIKTKMK